MVENVYRKALRQHLRAGELVTAPGVFDLVSARLVQACSFPAIYVSGFGLAASAYGLPDAGITGFSDMVGPIARIAELSTTPVIADADTGFGGLVNIRHTVRGYERAGVAAIQFEDQEFPKRCGHTGPRPVVSLAEMVSRVQVAVDTRQDEDFVIIARSDARLSEGFDSAVERGRAYAAAGADVVFLEALQSQEELEQAIAAIDVPLMVNMVPGGAGPTLSRATLAQFGVGIAIFPTLALMSAAEAIRRAYSALAAGEEVGEVPGQMAFADFQEMIGMGEIGAFEKRFSKP